MPLDFKEIAMYSNWCGSGRDIELRALIWKFGLFFFQKAL
jgi:hypothetical protein